MPSSNTSANKIAQQAARSAPPVYSQARVRKTARQVARSNAQSTVNGLEMMLFQINGTENWPLDVEKSKSTRVVYPDTIHEVEKAIYRQLLKTKKVTEAWVERKKLEVTGEQEKLIVKFDVPIFIMNPSNPSQKIYSEGVEIYNYHPPRHVKVSWKPSCTTDQKTKEENKQSIQYQKKNIRTDESVRLEIYHDRMLETIKKMSEEMRQLNLANAALRGDNQQKQERIDELEQCVEDDEYTKAKYRRLTGEQNLQIKEQREKIGRLEASLRRFRGEEDVDQMYPLNEGPHTVLMPDLELAFAPHELGEDELVVGEEGEANLRDEEVVVPAYQEQPFREQKPLGLFEDPQTVVVPAFAPEEPGEQEEANRRGEGPVVPAYQEQPVREQKPLELIEGSRVVVKEEPVAKVVIKTEIVDVE